MQAMLTQTTLKVRSGRFLDVATLTHRFHNRPLQLPPRFAWVLLRSGTQGSLGLRDADSVDKCRCG